EASVREDVLLDERVAAPETSLEAFAPSWFARSTDAHAPVVEKQAARGDTADPVIEKEPARRERAGDGREILAQPLDAHMLDHADARDLVERSEARRIAVVAKFDMAEPFEARFGDALDGQ